MVEKVIIRYLAIVGGSQNDHQDYHNVPGNDYDGSTGSHLDMVGLENTQDA